MKQKNIVKKNIKKNIKNKIKINITKKNLYKLATTSWKALNIIIIIASFIISIVSLHVAFLVREDTAELSKLSDKPIYYTISLYPTEEKIQVQVHDKYIRANLNLLVDDFKITKKDFLDINFNAVFTKIKYYMVYDYDIESNKHTYKYKCDKLDDKNTAQLRLEDKYHVEISELNYSLTPNNQYCYTLIYTETTSQKNLDLIFFKYYENSSTLDTIIENNIVKIDINRIDNDTNICKDYYTNYWSDNDSIKYEDLNFMFDVYNDLKDKLNDTL